MKKLLLIISILLLMLMFNNVLAESLTKKKSGYVFTRYDPRDGITTSADYYTYEIDNTVSYCIEPGIKEGTSDYVSSDWSSTGLDSKTFNEISLIAYYGYTYPGHNTMKYQMATQGLIWDKILGSDSWTRFSTDYWEKGEKIDVSEEKNEIEQLVSAHYQKPSFVNTVKTAYVGERIVLEDENNALNNFNVEINGLDGIDYSINENKITIVPNNVGTITVNIKKILSYSNQYKIFISNNHQNMYTVGNVDNITYVTRVNVLPKASVKIIKKSEETLNHLSLAGASYGLYDESDTLISTIKTDKYGEAYSDSILKIGAYYIKELLAPNGYEIDDEKHYFNVDGTKDLIEIEVNEKVIKKELTLYKQMYKPGTTPQIEKGISFEIIDESGKLFSTISTDENGFAKIMLPYGKYTVKQINTTAGYYRVDDFEISVDEKSSTNIFYSLIDDEITEYLKIVKIDENGNNIRNNSATFKIYDKTSNKYICHEYVNTKICEFKTDENGEINIPFKLSYGKYKLEEISSPEGYLKKDDIDFEIEGMEEVKTIYFINEKIKKDVIIKKIDSKSKEPLSNVSLAIYSTEDFLIAKSSTDKDGLVVIKNLPYGKYYVIEESTIAGYKKSDEKKWFDVNDDENTINVIFKNDPISANLIIKKVDDKNHPIGAVSFAIYDINDKLIGIYKTNDIGIIDVNLPYGEYYFKEYYAPDKYEMDSTDYHFSIDGSKEKIEYSIVNVPNTYKEKVNIASGNILRLLLLWCIICVRKLKVFLLH